MLTRVLSLFKRHKLLTILGAVVLTALLVFLFIPGFVHVKMNQGDYTTSIDSGSITSSKSNSSLLLVERGKHTISITKPGYQTVVKELNILPLFQYSINEELKPKILKDDLNTHSQIHIQGDVYVSFCDELKNSACISMPNGDMTEFDKSKDELKKLYSQDKNILPIFAEDVKNENKYLLKSPTLNIYLANTPGGEQPVLYVDSTEKVDTSELNKRIDDLLGDKNHNYSVIYNDQSPSNNSEGNYYWYDENEQFGEDYVYY